MYSLIVFYIIKMSSMSALLFVTLFITQSHSLTLFKTFVNGMVLQSAPTGAVIWGYLDNNRNNITLMDNCSTQKKQTQTIIPTVNVPRSNSILLYACSIYQYVHNSFLGYGFVPY